MYTRLISGENRVNVTRFFGLPDQTAPLSICVSTHKLTVASPAMVETLLARLEVIGNHSRPGVFIACMIGRIKQPRQWLGLPCPCVQTVSISEINYLQENL